MAGEAGTEVRIVLDEDLPRPLAEHLRSRGYPCESITDLRLRLNPEPGMSISDEEVCREVARVPSVLVTLNIRDYADIAFVRTLAEQYRISCVIVRPPKAEAKRGQRAPAIHDIVHRWAHRVPGLYNPNDPVIVSANRGGFRRRALAEIVVEQADAG